MLLSFLSFIWILGELSVFYSAFGVWSALLAIFFTAGERGAYLTFLFFFFSVVLSSVFLLGLTGELLFRLS